MVYKPHQQPGTFPKYLGHPSKLPLLKADYCQGNHTKRAVHWCRSPYLTSPVWYLEIYKLEWSKYVSLIKF